jgi:hypothetical protein
MHQGILTQSTYLYMLSDATFASWLAQNTWPIRSHGDQIKAIIFSH